MSDSKARAADAPEGKNPNPLTIPVNVSIELKEVVLAQPEMEEILGAARRIAVGACYCRTENGNCDRPKEVCLTLDADADRKIAEDAWQEIEAQDALQLLEATHRAGLVHLAFRNQAEEITAVCSCCSCCCEALGPLTKHTYKDGVVSSSHIATHNEETCVDCGLCIERCHFDAFTREEDGILFDPNQCFGCGLCVSTCPVGAIGFHTRS